MERALDPQPAEATRSVLRNPAAEENQDSWRSRGLGRVDMIALHLRDAVAGSVVWC